MFFSRRVKTILDKLYNYVFLHPQIKDKDLMEAISTFIENNPKVIPFLAVALALVTCLLSKKKC